MLLQKRIQFVKTMPDKLDATIVFIGQRIQYHGIEHEHTMHSPAIFQCVIQGRMVIQT